MTSALASLVGGLVAGAAGTLALDLLQYLRYRRGGGESNFTSWEFASGITSWDETSAPAKVGKLLFETTFRTELPASEASLTTNVMHWGYGLTWGAVFGVAVGSRSHMRAWQGPLLGLLVWLAGYVSLPIAGFYKPIWSYDLKTLRDDLGGHLVYGTGVAAAFWAACGS
jgi:hypothetical protein